jgi:hypothetical protein
MGANNQHQSREVGRLVYEKLPDAYRKITGDDVILIERCNDWQIQLFHPQRH